MITANDARVVLRVSAKLERMREDSLDLVDVSEPAGIFASDARKILRVSAKVDTF